MVRRDQRRCSAQGGGERGIRQIRLLREEVKPKSIADKTSRGNRPATYNTVKKKSAAGAAVEGGGTGASPIGAKISHEPDI
jgi:hypothetical protein